MNENNQNLDVTSIIQKEIDDNEVVLFMKGTPVFPMCGFSAAVVQILTELKTKFHSINVLDNPEIREGIKIYSKWPTIPQLYIKKEFIGGCDIVKEMHENGELIQLFKNKNISTNS
ncbi:MAG: Glutaredoxin-4 [Alphaproteobacteria bacterium MarineAlpha5_Bin11]|nr:monothiol glutaredoxin, Grx4 family [Pelagibacteraceae bacterium]PPR43693.1 MAG: Glutaredoxin-4 [Alphaproteobacteria bacterium MarineAlpha5_Bin11]PPR51345.1 MAG: Glutaredoxin-4 [Alphaproteobacteria bacterium MarineAlpha5_Bin10]|tara:strand:- start:129 stop:476 length:348 start_codon:yes stop_codon:yes gene_type:complete